MLKLNSTKLTLGNDDIKEYEEIKKSWKLNEEATKKSQEQDLQSNIKIYKTNNVHERIGFEQ